MFAPGLRRLLWLLALTLVISIVLLEIVANRPQLEGLPRGIAFALHIARFGAANALIWALWVAMWVLMVKLLWRDRASWNWRRAARKSALVLLPITVAHSLLVILLFELLPTTAGGFFPRNYAHDTTSTLLRLVLAEFGQGILVTGFALAFVYYTAVRESEIALERAQLQALRLQLQPHTLFNTLNGAVTLIRRDDTDTATRMLLGLADVLRDGLDQNPGLTCSLAEERARIANYLELQKIRYGQRLQFELAIPDKLAEWRVPTAILQPLVENSLCHGLDQKASAGRIQVLARASASQLELSVEDDGPGFAGPPVERIGLGNTRERLKRMFGDRAELSCSTTTSGGARVSIRLPRDGN